MNIIFLFLIISVLVGTTLLQTEMHIEVLGTKWLIENILRDSGLIVITFLSAKMTRKDCVFITTFSWEPLIEVAKVFAGIFVTMIPLLAILKAGEMGGIWVHYFPRKQ
ncbi:MAG: sodium:proton antiporter [Holosporaceae bacterium]|nr:MAG: sodium:proton antiporter [Holosporaceae bacterium]